MSRVWRSIADTDSASWWLFTWVVALSCLVLGPALAPGYVLSYDMVWVPDFTLGRADVWGLGSQLPRAVPSDAVVAMLGLLIPQMLVQKAILLGSLVAAGWGAAALARPLAMPARWAAATFMVWNPFVAERLGLGHWPLLVAYAAVPWLVIAVRDRRFAGGALLLAATALSPASGVMGVVVALVVGRFADAWRWLLLGFAVNAPWIVASVMSPASMISDPAGVGVFAARGRGSTPTWVEIISLGGVWNADVVPAYRETTVGTIMAVLWVGVVVAGVLLARRTRWDGLRSLFVLWLVGAGVALVGSFAPGALETIVEYVPGGGLLRDGSRWVVLMAPLSVVAVAHCVQWLTARPSTWAIGAVMAVALPLALIPDLGWGLAGNLRAVHYPDHWDDMATSVSAQTGPGDLVSLPFSAFRAPQWNHHRPVLDPAGRYFDRVTVTSDTLTVGDVDVIGEDRRSALIERRIRTGDWRAVADAGVGFVVLDSSAPGGELALDQVAELDQVALSGSLSLYEVPGATSVSPGWMRVTTVALAWIVALVTIVLAAIPPRWRRRNVRSASRWG